MLLPARDVRISTTDRALSTSTCDEGFHSSGRVIPPVLLIHTLPLAADTRLIQILTGNDALQRSLDEGQMDHLVTRQREFIEPFRKPRYNDSGPPEENASFFQERRVMITARQQSKGTPAAEPPVMGRRPGRGPGLHPPQQSSLSPSETVHQAADVRLRRRGKKAGPEATSQTFDSGQGAD